jgi:hypothetical protein
VEATSFGGELEIFNNSCEAGLKNSIEVQNLELAESAFYT